MSRLLHPVPGECVDRQTILILKIRAVSDKPRAVAPISYKTDAEGAVVETKVNSTAVVTALDPTPFMQEHDEIQAFMEKYWFPQLDEQKGLEFNHLFEQLQDANEHLWKLEDEARQLKEAYELRALPSLDHAAEVLFSINDWNDKRAEIVRSINQLWGIGHREKIYAND